MTFSNRIFIFSGLVLNWYSKNGFSMGVSCIRAIAFKRIQGGGEDFFKNARREGGSKR